jgi:hypothetical protein
MKVTIMSVVAAMVAGASTASAQRTQHTTSPTMGGGAPRIATIAPAPAPRQQQVYPRHFTAAAGFETTSQFC